MGRDGRRAAPASRVGLSGTLDLTVTAHGRRTAGKVEAAAGQPVVVTFEDPAFALAQLPRTGSIRAAAAGLASIGRLEVRRPDGTWLVRLYWHGGRGHWWWSPAGLRMLPRAAFLRARRGPGRAFERVASQRFHDAVHPTGR